MFCSVRPVATFWCLALATLALPANANAQARVLVTKYVLEPTSWVRQDGQKKTLEGTFEFVETWSLDAAPGDPSLFASLQNVNLSEPAGIAEGVSDRIEGWFLYRDTERAPDFIASSIWQYDRVYVDALVNLFSEQIISVYYDVYDRREQFFDSNGNPINTLQPLDFESVSLLGRRIPEPATGLLAALTAMNLLRRPRR